MTETINGTLRMLGDRLLLKPLDWDASKTIIAIRHGRPVRGEVVAVGPGHHPVSKRTNLADGRRRIDFSKRFRPTEVKPGDVVELGGLNAYEGAGYNFPQITIGTETFIIVQEQDVVGVREKEAA